MDNPAKKKIIFISHESSLTGAPIMLLNLLGLLKETNLFDIRIILFRGGTLEKEFFKYGKVSVLKSKNYSKQAFFLFRGLNFLIFRIKLLLLQSEIKDANVIFNNTITNGKILKPLSNSHTKVISYIHELESVIQKYPKDADLTLRYSDLLICPSNIVAQNLISNHKIPKEKLSFLNYYFPLTYLNVDGLVKNTSRKSFAGYLQFSDDKFYVVAMAWATYRKGIDIFVETARITKELKQNIHFVWIGDFLDNEMKIKIENEITTHQLEDLVTITGELPHSLENLLPFDLFILSSREDPYPLVVLEAALVKLPSVCFAGVGGAQEFIDDDCGWIIDEISSKKLSEKIIEIKNQKKEIKKRGENALEKCRRLHTNEELVINQFNLILEKVANL
jgi:glycosyltransferase involved in cell wall biosynthesis